MHIKRRVAAATLALALAIGGVVGIGGQVLDQPADEATEEAFGIYNFTGFGGKGGGAHTNGSTWS